ncbi:MAG: LacI family DNA-binding transcriptional regulator, partial [Calditrichaeota bacterium]
SIGTVDRVLHHRGRVRPEVEERIRKLLKTTNYRTNVYARNLVLGKTYRFGVVLPLEQQDSGYWQKSAESLHRAAESLASHHVRLQYYHFNKFSPESFQEALDKVRAESLDGLLSVPGFADQLIQFTQTCRIPLVVFGATATDIPCISCIGQDAEQSGFLAGRLMQLSVKNKARVAVIRVLPIDEHIEVRARGFESFFKDNSSIGLSSYEIKGNSDHQQFGALFRRILKENDHLQGIFVTNVNAHKLAVQIEEAGLAGQIHLIGYDLIDENIHFLKQGVIDFLINQRPERQSYEGIMSLFRHVVLKEAVNERLTMQIDIIVKENVDYYQDIREKL